MIIIKNFDILKKYSISKSVIALGTFDGIHIGHKKILKKAKEKSVLEKIPFIVFTFGNIPKEYLKLKKCERIIPLEKRYKIFEKAGVDILVEIEFTDTIKSIKYTDFIKDILVNTLKAKFIFVGFNFKFGFNRKGNAEILKKFQHKYDYKVSILRRVKFKTVTVSSSYIRKLLKSGEIETAEKLLGYYPLVQGVVERGKGRGKELGYPTANILTDKSTLIKTGIYATVIELNNKLYKSVTSVGKNPTFNEEHFTIETYIMNFNKNIYNKKISIYFIKRIRAEKNFRTVEILKKNIRNDIIFAAKLLKNILINKDRFI